MAGPKTIFEADECQALLDLIDELGCCPECFAEMTDEQRFALEKLRRAGQFYISSDYEQERPN